MSAVSRFLNKLAILLGRKRFTSELDEEMRFHREQAEKDLVTGGMTAEAARYAAMRQFGNATRLKEKSHEEVGFSMESVVQDLRFAQRQLRKNPGFTATVLLILTLGIGSSVAIFAFVDAALIKPLPYKDPNRLVHLFESIPIGPRFHLSYPDYLDWKKDNKVFSSLDAFTPFGFMQTTRSGLQQADGARVTAGFFSTLGVTPILGRDFYAGEEGPNAAPTVLLSYGAWQRRYGGRADVVGQTVILDGKPNTIIGVLPADFHFAPAEPADFWTVNKDLSTCRGCHGMFGVARLKDGVSFAAAYADIKAISEQLEKQYPDSNRDQVAFMLPLADVIVGDIRPIFLVVLCGSGLLLLIACANVSSLLLVRSESRRREMAVRGALGASPGRLLRQFVTEGLTLAAIGGLLGVACAREGMQVLTGLIPKDMMASMPFLHGIGLNGRVIGFAVALTLVTGLMFAFTPISRLRLKEIRDGLAQGGRGSAGVVWRRFGANLVVIELATAMVLLAGAGLLGKSFYRLLHVDIGIVPDHVATVRVDAEGPKYDKRAQRVALVQEILGKVQSLPGVKSAGITQKMPIEDGDFTTDFHRVDKPYHGEHWEVAVRSVSSGYMTTLQTRLVGGRYFNEDSDGSKVRVAIVNQALAKQYFPGEDPVGKQITFGGPPDQNMLVVGEINDIQEGQLDAKPRGAIYFPYSQNPAGNFTVLVRTAQDETNVLPMLVAAIGGIDPGLAVYQPSTLDLKIHDAPSTYLHRSSAWLVGGFAAMALLLGAVGLYGVIAYSVGQRKREIGVRMALGAERAAVCRLILMEAGKLIAVGVGLGLGASIASGVLMRKLLFNVEAWDVPTLLGVAALLTFSALLASYLPARRAASASPAESLRAE